MGHERGELEEVFGGDVVETTVVDATELGEVVVVATVEHVAFDELPQAFDQSQIGGIRRQEKPLDVERRRQGLHHGAELIASVVEHQPGTRPTNTTGRN